MVDQYFQRKPPENPGHPSKDAPFEDGPKSTPPGFDENQEQRKRDPKQNPEKGR